MPSSRVFLKKFEFSDRTAFVLEFGHQYIRFFADHGQVLKNNATYEIETPFTLSDLWDDKAKVCRLNIVQNNDILYLFHPKYMKTLTRYANDDWRLEDFELQNGPWCNINTDDTLTISADATEGIATLNATGNVFSPTDVGRLIRLNLYNDNTAPWAASKSVTAGQIMTSDGNYYKAKAQGTTGAVKPVHTEGERSDGAVFWQYLHSGYGIAKITEVTSANEAKAAIVSRMPDNISTPSFELGLLSSAAQMPSCGTFYKNRLALLVNTDEGLKCVLSQSNNFDNFSDKDGAEVTAECAITAPVLSDRYNEARWLSAGDVLFIGTSGGEFYLDTMTSAEALAPDNCKVVPISNIGSKGLTPIKVNGHTLFVDKYGTSIRDLIYSYERDGYDPFDATIKAKHLLKSGIVEWAYQDYPDKILWCVMASGQVVGFTFNTEQEVTALHQHQFGGMVESLTVIPSSDGHMDDLWLSVKRVINDTYERHIEWMDSGTPLIYPNSITQSYDWGEKELKEKEYDKQNAWYLDSALQFERTAGDNATIIGGLDHLKGEEVVIFADGAQKASQIVSDEGTIEIAKTDNHVVAGLSFQSVFKAKKRYLQGNATAGVGEVQRIDHLTLMLYRAGGGKVGSSFEDMVDILYRKTNEVMGQSAPLFTGNKVITMPGRTSTLEEKGADIVLVNDSAYPMTVLAISPQMTQSES